MSKVNFNVNAYTARLIGRENVSKLNGAVLELVKNTYDADSKVCILYYNDKENSLYIIDNGFGMNEEIIEKHWMTIGNSSKTVKFRTKNGRIQTGAKGIGRFALDRIADVCEMLTINVNNALLWNVDWRDFTSEKIITDVTAEINRTFLTINKYLATLENQDFQKLINRFDFSTGTVFKVTQLRDVWDTSTLTSLKNTLKTIVPPEFKSIFDIYLFTNDCTIDQAEVIKYENEFIYDYKIEFEVDELCNAKIKIYRDEFDFGHKEEEIFALDGFDNNDKRYFKGEPIIINKKLNELSDYDAEILNNIGPFRGVLYFEKNQFSLNDKQKYFYKEKFSNVDKTVFKGIKIYRDNFRVRPYGEQGSSNFDWLQLSNRRTLSPASISHKSGKWRVADNQINGSIHISRINEGLPDQSNREGIVDTKEFNAFKEIIVNIISLFEEDRQRVGRILSDYYDSCNKVSEIEKSIKLKAEKEKKIKKNRNEAEKISETHISASEAQIVIDKKDDIISSLEDENRLLRVLATTGIVTNTYIHEFKELTHKLKLEISLAYDALELDKSFEKAIHHLKKADEIKEVFNSWFQVTIDTVKKDKRKYKIINLVKLVNNIKKSWEKVLEPMRIKIFVNNNSEDIHVKGFTFEFESIFNNLISNSKTAFDNIDTDKLINIEVKQDEKYIYINYHDNGKGLSEKYTVNPYKILEPFETNKMNENGEKVGTGMGMWIINKTVSEYKGKLILDENLKKEHGFYITIILPKETERELCA